MEWYRTIAIFPGPEFCSVHLYNNWELEEAALVTLARTPTRSSSAPTFPDAIAATEALLASNAAPLIFYDIDTPVTMAHSGNTDAASTSKRASSPGTQPISASPAAPCCGNWRTGSVLRAPCRFTAPSTPKHIGLVAAQAYRCAMSYLGTYAADRQPKLMQMLNGTALALPEETFLVAGPLYPEGTPWAANVMRIPHVAPPDHPAFYSSARFTLNLTRQDMVQAGYSPSVRLFEASACGAAILSDPWPGIEDFLTPGEEILLPRDGDEIVRILRDLSDEERHRLGRRARERILAEHTSVHRAQELEAVVASCSVLR